MSVSSWPTYLKAILSLRSYMSLLDEDQSRRLSLQSLVERWIVNMYLSGLSPKSRMLYLNAIAALYGTAARAGLAAETTIFSSVKARLKTLQGSPEFIEAPTDEQFQRLQRLLRTFSTLRESQRLFPAIIALSLIGGAIDPVEIARWKVSDLATLPDEARSIALPFATPGRRYVFPLQQSFKTPAQLARLIDKAVVDTFRQYCLPVYGDASATLRAYWAAGALRVGASPESLLSIPALAPGSLPILPIVTSLEPSASPEERKYLVEEVARLFSAEPPGWYAMRLRPSARYEALTERIYSTFTPAEAPELFYPSREIARRVNRRLTYETQPILPGIVFFRSTLAAVRPLMRLVGDLAWCYTTPDGIYARIHSASMDLFQRCIGQFTPDYEVAPQGTLDLRPGDTVEIIGGTMAGLRGTLLQTLPSSSGTIYRLSLLGDTLNIEYRLTDPRLLRPA